MGGEDNIDYGIAGGGGGDTGGDKNNSVTPLLMALPEDRNESAVPWVDHSIDATVAAASAAAPTATSGPASMVNSGSSIGCGFDRYGTGNDATSAAFESSENAIAVMSAFRRMGLSTAGNVSSGRWSTIGPSNRAHERWTVSLDNSNFSISPSYPSVLCLPWSASEMDGMVQAAALFRQRRLPAVTWVSRTGYACLIRSAAPVLTGPASSLVSAAAAAAAAAAATNGASSREGGDVPTTSSRSLDGAGKESDDASTPMRRPTANDMKLAHMATSGADALATNTAETGLFVSNDSVAGATTTDTTAFSPTITPTTTSIPDPKPDPDPNSREEISPSSSSSVSQAASSTWYNNVAPATLRTPKMRWHDRLLAIADADARHRPRVEAGQSSEASRHLYLLCDAVVRHEVQASGLAVRWDCLCVEEGTYPLQLAPIDASDQSAHGGRVASGGGRSGMVVVAADASPSGTATTTTAAAAATAANESPASTGLTRACLGQPELSLPVLEKSGWLSQVAALLHWSSLAADLLQLRGATVLVCLETGSVQTAQLVSLIQILVDPHTRSMEGFGALVRKEWLAFGHDFGGGAGSRAFVQFLDAVSQLAAQFPSLFEFGNLYLETLAYHTMARRFGTFLHASERERAAAAKTHSMASMWRFLEYCNVRSPNYYNFYYRATTAKVRPHVFVPRFIVWSFYTNGFVRDGMLYDAPYTGYIAGDAQASVRVSLLRHATAVTTAAAAEAAAAAAAGHTVLSSSSLSDLNGGWQEVWKQALSLSTTAKASATAAATTTISTTQSATVVDAGGSTRADSAAPGDGAERSVGRKRTKGATSSITRGRSLRVHRVLPVELKGRLPAQLLDASGLPFMQPHRFEHQRLRVPLCDHCGSTIWGIATGWTCVDCSLTVHERCRPHVPPNCSGSISGVGGYNASTGTAVPAIANVLGGGGSGGGGGDMRGYAAEPSGLSAAEVRSNVAAARQQNIGSSNSSSSSTSGDGGRGGKGGETIMTEVDGEQHYRPVRSPPPLSPQSLLSPSPAHDAAKVVMAAASPGKVQGVRARTATTEVFGRSTFVAAARRVSKKYTSDGSSAGSGSSNSNSAHAPEYHGTTGLLYKQGGIIRTWKLRWCFLDAVLRQIRYYRPPTNTELKGVIYLDLVTQVRALDQYGGNEAPYLELLTRRRNWLLRAASTEQREMWVEAIAHVITSRGTSDSSEA